MAMPDIVIRLDSGASREEVDAVRETIASIQLAADVRADWEREPETGNGAFWIVLLKLGSSPFRASSPD